MYCKKLVGVDLAHLKISCLSDQKKLRFWVHFGSQLGSENGQVGSKRLIGPTIIYFLCFLLKLNKVCEKEVGNCEF